MIIILKKILDYGHNTGMRQMSSVIVFQLLPTEPPNYLEAVILSPTNKEQIVDEGGKTSP